MKPVAIFLFELSGKSAEPFAAAGWDCYCIDIAHQADRSDGNVHFIRADARHWKPTRDMVVRCRFFAAFPPCDHLAVSGARWFAGKGLHKLSESVELFAIAAEWAEFFEVPYMIENPVSTISTYWRKPDHTFDPWQFTGWAANDNYSKKTCLWTGGGFVMPAVNSTCQAIDKKRVLNAPRNTDRANVRSVSPIGFMRALYAANFARKLAA
ncbi:hypothetical protein [Mesorhizobium sp.]|uniref:hypothetical protein n=1 Tax=Mesorhizobium sp. TaxID=1871066 RepID=UPI00257C5AC9|nr:hypothetical protein [Mesorhizobium sp.]